MNKYQKGKIYKIVSNVTDDVYICSTCESRLSNRLGGHKTDYKRYLANKRTYVSSFKILETGDYDIVLIEDFPCERKEQLFARERYWIDHSENCVNNRRPGAQIGAISKKQYDKDYRRLNQDKIIDYE